MNKNIKFIPDPHISWFLPMRIKRGFYCYSVQDLKGFICRHAAESINPEEIIIKYDFDMKYKNIYKKISTVFLTTKHLRLGVIEEDV